MFEDSDIEETYNNDENYDDEINFEGGGDMEEEEEKNNSENNTNEEEEETDEIMKNINKGDEEDNEDEDEDDDDVPDDDDDDEVKQSKKNTKNTKNNINNTYLDDNSDSESESDDELDNMELNKIDNDYKLNFINEIHPEEINDNYMEIMKYVNVNRNSETNIIENDPYHQTLPILTKYERTRILGLRITQLNKGAVPFVDIKNKFIIDNNIIAEKELKEKKLPFIIMRPLPNGIKEYWKLEDLEIVDN